MKTIRLYVLIVTFLTLGAGIAVGQTARSTERQNGLPADGPPSLEESANYRVRTVTYGRREIVDGDTLYVYQMTPIPVFAKAIDISGQERLIRNLKIVYPIAKFANSKLHEMEQVLATMEGQPRKQQQYIKQVEKELKEQYTPILKRMSFSQGKILIKLIDRETGHTTYNLVKEMRGNFSAFFWQNLGRLFGMNLKTTYDKEGEDRLLERLIILYEAGLI
ncbi:MAG: DUF4294 domain-containing protein [Rikenellaceae bacterium]|nr:DUF4294 domain-containing protein [Rikenellaceae bacterium]